MKKIFLVMACLLLLSGCGNVKLKNGEKAVVTFKEGAISSDELYKVLKDNYGARHLMDLMDAYLLGQKYKNSSEENKYIDQTVKAQKEKAKELNADFDTYLAYYYGVQNEDDYRKSLSLNYRKDLWAQDYAKESVTDKQVKEYYESEFVGDMEASHILITIDAKSDSEEDKKAAEEKALETAKSVIQKLNDGEDFKALAKKYSKDSDTAKNGGSLGKINVGDYTAEVIEALKELKPKEYSKTPIMSSYGYHIVYLESQDKKAELDEKVTDKIKTIIGTEISSDSNFSIKAIKALREQNKTKIVDKNLEKSINQIMQQYELQASQSNNEQ